MAKAKKTAAVKSSSAKSKPTKAPAKEKIKEKPIVKAKATAVPVKVVSKEAKAKEKAPEAAPKPSSLEAKPEKIKKVAAEKPVKVPKVVVPKVKKPTKAALALTEETRRWSDFNAKHSSEKAKTYQMADVYESGTPLQHKILGWGWILNVENDRLEVLFEQGKKFLISNYKPK